MTSLTVRIEEMLEANQSSIRVLQAVKAAAKHGEEQVILEEIREANQLIARVLRAVKNAISKMDNYSRHENFTDFTRTISAVKHAILKGDSYSKYDSFASFTRFQRDGF